jgi:lipoyl-dependent peroxiredoxin subunit D
MSLTYLLHRLPGYASDIKLNLERIFLDKSSKALSPKHIYGVAMSASYALNSDMLLSSIGAGARVHLSAEEVSACRAVSVTMAMTNVYYRSLHLADFGKDASKPKFTPQISGLQKSGMDVDDLALCCFAVSALNGCKYCMDVHIEKLLASGKIDVQGLYYALYVCSVLRAARDSLDIDGLHDYDFLAQSVNLDD